MTSETAAQIDEAACGWAARIDRGLSSAESAGLAEWLAGDRRRRGALLRAQAGLSLLDRARALGPDEEEEPAPSMFDRRRVMIGGGGIAAALAAGIGWTLWPSGRTFTTARGEIRDVALEDGSRAMVNSGSEVHVRYDSKRRNIRLAQGEAWFQVAKNKTRPFVVTAGPARVEAVGTAFDVRRRDTASEVVVTEGVVRIWPATGKSFLLREGHRASIGDFGGLQMGPVSHSKAEQQLAWRQHRVVLDDMTLAAAAEEFNRYHDVQLQIDPALAQRQVVGSFGTDDLDGFARASAALVGGHVEREGKIVRIVQ